MGIIIYHNPRCTKSRETLKIIEDKELPVTVVEYLHQTPGFLELRNILRFLGVGPRDIMRTGEQVYKDLGLKDKELSDKELIKIMTEHPILIERPIVVNGDTNQAAIGRPPENILGIL